MIRNLAALALIALISAGCGSNAPSETATASSTATATNKKPTGQARAVKFAECIRAHGVRDFPDPNAKGDFEYGVSVTVTVWTQGRQRVQGPAATGLPELEAEPQAADGEPEVRPVHPRERREGLPGSRQR